MPPLVACTSVGQISILVFENGGGMGLSSFAAPSMILITYGSSFIL